MVFDCAVSAQEMQEHAPHIRSALPQYERKMDFLGGWGSAQYAKWKLATLEVDLEYGHYCCSASHGLAGIGTDANVNLTSAQKELLLWHWRLGISMQRVQELMRVVEVVDENGAVSVMDRVICPRIKSASTCPIPMCKSCQLSRAKQRKPNVVKTKAVQETAGSLSKEKYETAVILFR